jgi:hypothetical protein
MAANACRSAAVAVASNATLKWVPLSPGNLENRPPYTGFQKSQVKPAIAQWTSVLTFLFSDPSLTNVPTPDIAGVIRSLCLRSRAVMVEW